jgi:hypothetical protein
MKRPKPWEKIGRPACACTHTLSLYGATLCSVRKPRAVLPGVSCPCGRTWYRYRDGQLFRVPQGQDHR